MRNWLRGLLALVIMTLLAATPAFAQPDTPPVCTAGSSGIGDSYFPYMGNSGYDVRHYTLDLDLDVANGAIRAGQATIQATATSSLCAFNLDFNGLEIDQVSVDGAPAEHFRRGQELTITPRFAIPRGGEFVVDVAYHGTPFTLTAATIAESQALVAGLALDPGVSPDIATPEPAPESVEFSATPVAEPDAEGDGMLAGIMGADVDRYGWSLGGWWKAGDTIFVAGEPRGAETWYPVNGHPADKATYTFRLTTDKPYAAVANGPLVERTETADQTTAVYAPRDPISSYLVTLHAGELDVVDGGEATTGVPLRYVFAAGVPDDQRASLMTTTEAVLPFFTERFGPYPFDLAGGTVVDSILGFALETQTMPVYGGNPDLSDLPAESQQAIQDAFEETIAHELAHQWWGNSASPLRWQDVFLNEGLAQYSAYLWIEQRDGPEVMRRRLQQSYNQLAVSTKLADPATLATMSARDVLDLIGPPPNDIVMAITAQLGLEAPDALADLPAADAISALTAIGIPVDQLLGEPPVLTGDPGPRELFAYGSVYERGALTMHALRLELGDELFFETLRRYAATYHNGNATVTDFMTVAEVVSGKDLQPLFDAWLYQLPLPPLDFAK